MLPHFCAAGACIHELIIALYIWQRNILIVSAFNNAHQQFKRQAAKNTIFLHLINLLHWCS